VRYRRTIKSRLSRFFLVSARLECGKLKHLISGAQIFADFFETTSTGSWTDLLTGGHGPASVLRFDLALFLISASSRDMA